MTAERCGYKEFETSEPCGYSIGAHQENGGPSVVCGHPFQPAAPPASEPEEILVHRFDAKHPWRTCDGRIGRSGELEHCVFRGVEGYEHAVAVIRRKP